MVGSRHGSTRSPLFTLSQFFWLWYMDWKQWNICIFSSSTFTLNVLCLTQIVLGPGSMKSLRSSLRIQTCSWYKKRRYDWIHSMALYLKQVQGLWSTERLHVPGPGSQCVTGGWWRRWWRCAHKQNWRPAGVPLHITDHTESSLVVSTKWIKK